jgi:hypothetical protein
LALCASLQQGNGGSSNRVHSSNSSSSGGGSYSATTMYSSTFSYDNGSKTPSCITTTRLPIVIRRRRHYERLHHHHHHRVCHIHGRVVRQQRERPFRPLCCSGICTEGIIKIPSICIWRLGSRYRHFEWCSVPSIVNSTTRRQGEVTSRYCC